MKRVYIAILILVSLFFGTCDIGLGSRLNLDGPAISIFSPTPNRTIGQTDPVVNKLFDLYGEVHSKTKVKLMTVTVDYYNSISGALVKIGREWKWEGSWQSRESSDDLWTPYTEESYSFVEYTGVVNPPLWSVKDEVVTWNLPVSMDRMERGDHFITVSAWDAAGNHDANSSVILKVVYNNEAPSLRIIIPDAPTLKDSDRGSLSHPLPPVYDMYIFDPFGDPYNTYMHMKNFVSDFSQLAYYIEVDGNYLPGGYTMALALTNAHNLDTKAERTTYWDWESGSNDVPQRGIFLGADASGIGSTETINNVNYIKVDRSVELYESVDNLPRNTITPMQIVSRVEDIANNVEYKSKGWVLYLPDADKPYVDINFGTKIKAGATVPPNTPNLREIPRGTVDRNNYAYDDDGLQTVTWTLYKLMDTSLQVDETFTPVSRTIAMNGGEREAWEFTAARDYGIGRFKIVVVAQDVNGTYGDEYHAYFSIISNSTPTIKSFDSGLINNTLFGSAGNGSGVLDGDFHIKGLAQIEDFEDCDGINHNLRVDRVTIAWIRPGLTMEDTLPFREPSYSDWENQTLKDRGYYENSLGIKFWEVDTIDFVMGTAGNKNGNYQEDWEFNKKLNIFTDLNIGNATGQNRLDGQEFIIRPASNNGNRVLASIATLSTRGDTAVPIVSITKLSVHEPGFPSPVDYTFLATPPNAPLSGLIPVITPGTRVKLSGTWSDDSMGAWTSGDRHITRMRGRPVVIWQGETLRNFTIEKFDINSNSNGGTWETGEYTFAEKNEDAGVRLEVSLTDLGGNQGDGYRDITIITDNPALTRISSTAANGIYGYNKDNGNARAIEIFLEFNKSVRFIDPAPTPGSSSPLTLTLNNGGTAYYSGGGGSTRLSFTYNIPSDTSANTDKLNVSGLTYTDKNIRTALIGTEQVAQAVFPDDNTMFNGAMSLGNQKSIVIDNTPPSVTGVTTSSLAKTYGKDSQIYITVTFNEQIQVSGSPTITLDGGLPNGIYASSSERSIIFMYTVVDGHNADPLTVTGIAGNITDIAENPLTSIPNGTKYQLTGIRINTTRPPTPSITGVATGTSYYGPARFRVRGLESNAATVEYHFNYTNDEAPGWDTYSGVLTADDQNSGKFMTSEIAIPLNGTYNIAARQYDTAETTKNVSDSVSRTNVRVDVGNILQRISSSNADGSYTYGTGKNSISIDVYLRIPVTVTGTPTVTLNTNPTNPPKTANFTKVTDLSNGTSVLTFTYDIAEGDNIPLLDVTGFNWGSCQVNDKSAVSTDIKQWISLNDLSASNRFNGQKRIEIVSGRPTLVANGFSFTPTIGTTNLQLTYNRDIFPGSTGGKIVIRQVANDYRIPVVMTEKQFLDIFDNRSDVFADFTETNNSDINTWGGGTNASRAAKWKELGQKLYLKGSNGADIDGATATPDTTVKYVLKFDVDPLAAGTYEGLSMENIRIIFRCAEALTFRPNDPAVSISGSVLKVDLSSSGLPLPVLGATYDLTYPNGFIKDTLGIANSSSSTTDNTSPTGTDSNVTRTITYTVANTAGFVEIPVIRYNKGEDAEKFNDGSGNRHALQMLQSSLKIDCRTPGSSIQFARKNTVDNVSQLIMRNGNGNPTTTVTTQGTYINHLPNIGERYRSQTAGNVSNDEYRQAAQRSFEDTKMRPQSGVAGRGDNSPITGRNWVGVGLNYFTAMVNTWPTDGAYTAAVTLGTNNYLEGGLEFHIRARARVGTGQWSDYAYEAAYRSVFVFNMATTVAGNTRAAALNLGGTLNRVWVRGGNTANGDPTITDFPIARDPRLWSKARLLTPITPGTITNDTSLSRNNDDIPTGDIGTGSYLWFWVTWKINVPAYLDILYGELPPDPNEHQSPQTNIRYYFKGYIPSKEHYALFPGRTTIAETRAIYDWLWDGQHGELDLTSATTAPPRID